MKKIISRLLGRPSEELQQPDLGVPNPLECVGIVGDIHGRADLLELLIDQLEANSTTVFVGDYVDRGPDSKRVLELLQNLQSDPSRNVICLKGNHEKMLLDFIDNPLEKGRHWLRFGGVQTLQSFGISDAVETSSAETLTALRDALTSSMSEGMNKFIRDLPMVWHSGNLSVVHGGLNPERDRLGADEKTMLWGSAEFMRRARSDGAWVAHGHVICDEPYMRDSRISVDTGAYMSNRLTWAIVSPEGDVEFRQVKSKRFGVL